MRLLVSACVRSRTVFFRPLLPLEEDPLLLVDDMCNNDCGAVQSVVNGICLLRHCGCTAKLLFGQNAYAVWLTVEPKKTIAAVVAEGNFIFSVFPARLH
mmetsp:Transcript_4517/g.6015  ORF Transcript_4517/g.6015 Transcript_4517/m.6015 type:complete len:99 (-) Transcript_4517:90-386(-)